jgi:hypothetical protein
MNGDLHSHIGVMWEEDDIPQIHADGCLAWWKNGRLHRGGDLPAVVGEDGYQAWYTRGMRHRDNELPAVIYGNGDKEWYINGERIHE